VSKVSTGDDYVCLGCRRDTKLVTEVIMGPDSSVGIASRYGLDGPGIESRWGGEIFRTHPDRSWGPPSLVYEGYRDCPGGKTAGAWR
jgi:hypothetical protein